MRCPVCGFQDDKVIDSRVVKEGFGVRRRRECLACSHRFSTYESIIQSELKVVKRNSEREDFDADKLRLKHMPRALYIRVEPKFLDGRKRLFVELVPVLHGVVVDAMTLDPGELLSPVRADEDGGGGRGGARPTRGNFTRFSLQKFLCHFDSIL